MSWPIVDRPDLRAAAFGELRAHPPRAVVLRGPSGIGKTTLASAIAAEWAAGGGQVLEVVGLAELRGAPLAPFVPLLAAMGAEPGAATGITAHDVIAAVGATAPAALLVVDDAPLLDETSAAVIYHLRRAYALPMVMTCRSEHPVDGPLAQLDREGLTTTFEVPGLERRAIEEVLRGRLGAPLRPDDVGRLEAQTAGNPLHLRELIDLAQRWGWTKRVAAGVELEPVDLPAGLDASIADRVARLTDPEIGVLRLVALGAAAPSEALLTSGGERTIAAALARDGFVVPRADGTVCVAHPSYGEAAVAGLNPEGRDRLLRRGGRSSGSRR